MTGILCQKSAGRGVGLGMGVGKAGIAVSIGIAVESLAGMGESVGGICVGGSRVEVGTGLAGPI